MPVIGSVRLLLLAMVLALSAITFLAAAPPASLDGWWLSDGYGTFVEIRGDQIKTSEITAISCLPDWTAKRQPQPVDGAEAVFQGPGRFLVKAGSSTDHKFLQFPGAASSVGIRRIDRPPAVCAQPAANTPENNFDIFWTTFNEHYPFFALHGVNWRKLRDKYRSQVAEQTTPEELFGILKAMVEPLHDAHVFIRGTSPRQRFHALRENTHEIGDQAERRIREIIETKYLQTKLNSWCNGRVSFGMVSDSLGYLRITAFAGYSRGSDFEAQAQALEDALDQVFQDSAKLRGLVIDVRINHGGSDVLGVAVTSRLAAKEYLAFAKKARNDPGDPTRFTVLQETAVRVSTRPHFRGKVVLLTGGNTVSAGETFTMALMGRTPAVIRVGENTQGVFSDVLGRKLPNGFRFGLPNEIFVTEDGKAFDGPGIPPHVPVAVFPKVDLAKGRDGALEKARDILLGK
jgi:hypothetical protein